MESIDRYCYGQTVSCVCIVFGDFTFHIPCQKDEVNELEILDEEIDGEISAEKTRNVDINFRQAMLLLENYSGVKAAGTYNKKPEFY